MPDVALTFVVLQEEKVPLSRERERLREVPYVNWQVWRLKKSRTTGYMGATRTTKIKTPLPFR